MLDALDDASPNEELGGFVGDSSWHACGTVSDMRAVLSELLHRRAAEAGYVADAGKMVATETLRAERDEAADRAVEAVEAFIENLELEDRGLVRAKRGMAPRRLDIVNQVALLRKVAVSIRSTLSPEEPIK